jgi:hypothetical protein
MKKINITCIIDMSSSMEIIRQSSILAFNKFLDGQKKDKKNIDFTLMFFNTCFNIPYKNVKIDDVKPIDEKTYIPKGCTALYDAIGYNIDDYVDYLGKTPKKKRPCKSLFVILTDGEENSSRVFCSEKIKMMITDLRENLNVEFIYLGANHDACFVSESIGIDKSNSYEFESTNQGIAVAYSKISQVCDIYYKENDDVKNS